MADQPNTGDGHERSPLPSTAADLERSFEAFLRELEIIRELESRTMALAADDPERPDLAGIIEERLATLMGRNAYQRRLIEEGFRKADGALPRHPSAALHDWRDAEHRLIEVRSTLQRALEESERYQREYRAAFERERAASGSNG